MSTPAIQNSGLIERLTELGERAAAGTGIEIVELQLRGSGNARLLRVYIDKTGGVTHGDCQLISEKLSRLLDEKDAVPGDSYTLEVSSLGVERNLVKRRDFERVLGHKIRVSVREPIEGERHFEGRLADVVGETLELDMTPGRRIRIPLDRIQKAKLKFEW